VSCSKQFSNGIRPDKPRPSRDEILHTSLLMPLSINQG
jgi:hypothetical protein